MTFHTTNRQIIISGCQVIAHLHHNNYGPASRHATANRRQPTPRARHRRARCNLMTAKLLAKRLKSSTKTTCFGLQFGTYCIAIWCLSETKTSCFGRWQLNGCRPLSRKGEPGAPKSCFSQPLAPTLQTRKKGAENLVIRQLRRIFAVESCSDSCHTYAFHSGLTGFDGEMKWYVSTRSVGGLLLNLSLQAINWQQQVCSRCLVEAQ